MDFSETIVVYDIKVGSLTQLNEYMNLYEYQRSSSFVDHPPRSLRFNIFKLLLLRNCLADWRSLHVMWGMKIQSNVPGHMTMPIYGEKLKQSSSSEPRGWWLWNLVYSIGYSTTTSGFIWWPWVDLDHFYDKVKFVSEYYCMSESLYSIECWCIFKFVLIRHILSTQGSDTGPLVLWFIVPLLKFICFMFHLCPVWSESKLSTWRIIGSWATHKVHKKGWSDWADAQADLSLLGAQLLCWFCRAAAHISSVNLSREHRAAILFWHKQMNEPANNVL